MTDLPAPLAAFAAASAEAADPASLAGAAEADLVRLVDALEGAGRRAHLERIGQSQLARPLRKRAKRAAYKLKSAGVSETVAPTGGLQIAPVADLSEVALIGAPGSAGQYWIFLSELDDAAPLSLEAEAWGSEARVRRLDHLSRGRLRQYEREMKVEQLVGRPCLADAGLAVRMVAHLTAELRARGGVFPEGWADALWWCERAQALGADLDAADARARLGNRARDVPQALRDASAEVIDELLSGPHLPPQAAMDALLAQALEAVEADVEWTREELDEQLSGLAASACDAFYADPRHRAIAARALGASADLLAARGLDDRALQCLWVADELAEGALLPHEIPLLRHAFGRVIDFDAAWAHRVAHREGRTLEPEPEGA